MTKTLIFAAAAMSVAPALAQAPKAPAAPSPISRANFVAQLNSAFAAVDTNHDGYLSISEIEAAQAREVARAQAAAKAAAEAEFRRLDTN
ncbi:MAG TPA: hypothetical protein VJ846_07825, partial [Sphingomicrobium sp.]|nr:hypothetical protein [Sphingomicrobium sp.]